MQFTRFSDKAADLRFRTNGADAERSNLKHGYTNPVKSK